MAIVTTNDQHYTDIANAIRAKTGTEQTYTPENMAAAIEGIPDGTKMEDLLIERPSTFTEYSNDRVTEVGQYAFYRTALKNVSIPNATVVGSYAFSNAYAVQEFYWPKVARVLSNAFYTISTLTRIAFDSAVNFYGQNSLAYCSALNTVVLKANELCTLGNVNVFQRTPIEDGTGYIYVPDDLVDQYKEATNWLSYANQIKGLSEIPTEVQQWLEEQEALYGTN